MKTDNTQSCIFDISSKRGHVGHGANTSLVFANIASSVQPIKTLTAVLKHLARNPLHYTVNNNLVLRTCTDID